jgi:hypothetical protein
MGGEAVPLPGAVCAGEPAADLEVALLGTIVTTFRWPPLAFEVAGALVPPCCPTFPLPGTGCAGETPGDLDVEPPGTMVTTFRAPPFALAGVLVPPCVESCGKSPFGAMVITGFALDAERVASPDTSPVARGIMTVFAFPAVPLDPVAGCVPALVRCPGLTATI